MRYLLTAAAGASLLGACATNAHLQHELAGKPLRVETVAGDVVTVLLKRDGTTTLTNLKGEQVSGRWRVDGSRLCVAYPMTWIENECVSYDGPLRRGVKTPIRNTEEHVGWVTIL